MLQMLFVLLRVVRCVVGVHCGHCVVNVHYVIEGDHHVVNVHYVIEGDHHGDHHVIEGDHHVGVLCC
jgi:hypothetical protein